MKFKSAEDFIKYIYEELSLHEIGLKNVDPFKMYDLLDKTPPEFKDDKTIKELNQLCLELDAIDYHGSYDAWFLPNYSFSLDKSILRKFEISNDTLLKKAVKVWIDFAIEDFYKILQDIYEPCIRKSIDELKLFEMELKELNKFFDSGYCKSIAVNVDEGIFKVNLLPDDIFEYYLNLIRGQYTFFIVKDDYIHFRKLCDAVFDETSIPAICKDDRLLEEKKNIDYGTAIEKMNLALNALKNEWWLAVRIQALLWIKQHIEKMLKAVKKEKIKDLKLPTISMDELIQSNFGFNVKNEKIISDLYKALAENKLIQVQGVEQFRKAFKGENGFIIWLGGSTHGIGVNSLIYLIDKMVRQNLIENENFIKITESVFRDRKNKVFKYNSLTQTNAANVDTPPKNKATLDAIVDHLIHL